MHSYYHSKASFLVNTFSVFDFKQPVLTAGLILLSRLSDHWFVCYLLLLRTDVQTLRTNPWKLRLLMQMSHVAGVNSSSYPLVVSLTFLPLSHRSRRAVPYIYDVMRKWCDAFVSESYGNYVKALPLIMLSLCIHFSAWDLCILFLHSQTNVV